MVLPPQVSVRAKPHNNFLPPTPAGRTGFVSSSTSNAASSLQLMADPLVSLGEFCGRWREGCRPAWHGHCPDEREVRISSVRDRRGRRS